ncbi:MAG: PAS domain S-box protein, partial [Desulfobulbaceae bacterium]|nr:PAS domain S-box protein [Desulfobulbaceae bacterium]
MANQAKQRKIEKNSCVVLKERIVELERQLELYKKTHSETQRLAVVVKDSNDAVTVQDLQGNITAWNYGAERIYGYTEAEALQMNIFQIIPKDKKRETLQFFKRIKNGETNESFETQRLTKEGETLDVWLTVTPLRDSKGKLREIATTERDITDRKQIEASLKIRT